MLRGLFIGFAIIVSVYAYSNNEAKQLLVGISKDSSFVDGVYEQKYYFVPSSSSNTIYNVRLTRRDAFFDVKSAHILRVTYDGITQEDSHSLFFSPKSVDPVEITVSGEGEGFRYSVRVCEGECESNCNGECNGHGGCVVVTGDCHCDIGFAGKECNVRVLDDFLFSSSSNSALRLAFIVIACVAVGVVVVVFTCLGVVFGCIFCCSNVQVDGEDGEEVTDCAHCCPMCGCCDGVVTIKRSGFKRHSDNTEPLVSADDLNELV